MNTDDTSLTRIENARNRVREELISRQNSEGHWEGELSGSSLSTATAVSAMAAILLGDGHPMDAGNDGPSRTDDCTDRSLGDLVKRGIEFLQTSQNPDGGFGDTDRSHSNIATSYLVLAASTLAHQAVGAGIDDEKLGDLQRYIEAQGSLDGLRKRYGTDKTFVVPILSNLAIAGLVPWNKVPSLPFELAAFPQSMFRWLRMPVVSYAIPALVAIGQAKHLRRPTYFLPLRWIRSLVIGRTLKVLKRMQPQSGGYLEATPLTAFVMMSLAATGRGSHPVCKQGTMFLAASIRSDGSWPIDTNLATWVTSLSLLALMVGEDSQVPQTTPDNDNAPQRYPAWYRKEMVDWLLACQHRSRHPFTGADPGGWGWTNLSGAVPDGDDTPAAILALCEVKRFADSETQNKIDNAVRDGEAWLLGLQNRDGGMPTFCRGWGKLPFDRSSTDLTAHALRAFERTITWDRHADNPGPQVGTPEPQSGIPEPQSGTREQPAGSRERQARQIDQATTRGRRFLINNQQADGSWLPLWFGNQDRTDEENPVYGTAKVLLAMLAPAASGASEHAGGAETLGSRSSESADHAAWALAAARGANYLVESQNSDGGWGGGVSVDQSPLVNQQLERAGVAKSGRPESPKHRSTVEETALAVEALVRLERERDGLDLSEKSSDAEISASEVAILGGVEFLVQAVETEQFRAPWPIGFYFAKLWYYEELYPIIFTVSALSHFLVAERDDGKTA